MAQEKKAKERSTKGEEKSPKRTLDNREGGFGIGIREDKSLLKNVLDLAASLVESEVHEGSFCGCDVFGKKVIAQNRTLFLFPTKSLDVVRLFWLS